MRKNPGESERGCKGLARIRLSMNPALRARTRYLRGRAPLGSFVVAPQEEARQDPQEGSSKGRPALLPISSYLHSGRGCPQKSMKRTVKGRRRLTVSRRREGAPCGQRPRLFPPLLEASGRDPD